jgi:deoxyribodipyrimidine photo-lyase
MPTAVFWFRNDLRLHDHPALLEAIAKNDNLLPVYIVDPDNYKGNTLGFSQIGPYRKKFLKESVFSLKQSFQSMGADLIVLSGKSTDLLPEIMQQIRADKLYCSFDPGFNEQQEITQLQSILRNHAQEVICIQNNFLLDTSSLPFSIEQLPDIFTEFRKKVEKYAQFPLSLAAPTDIPYLLNHHITDNIIPEWETEIESDSRAVLDFKGGEEEALNRLKDYIWTQDLLKVYKETRNGLIGADYSSKLSPWLALGCISPRYIYAQVKQYESERIANQSTYWLIFELLWREYFRFLMMKYGKAIFSTYGIKGHSHKRMENNLKKFQQWVNGETVEPFVNANMNELRLTGFMSNRGRQNVASYLVNDLKVNWQWGAAYFESLLIDYDVSSNWCNWNYIAGIGTDPREDRYFNIRKQSDMYDPDGKYVQLWRN